MVIRLRELVGLLVELHRGVRRAAVLTDLRRAGLVVRAGDADDQAERADLLEHRVDPLLDCVIGVAGGLRHRRANAAMCPPQQGPWHRTLAPSPRLAPDLSMEA